jgi:hypothetical protein
MLESRLMPPAARALERRENLFPRAYAAWLQHPGLCGAFTGNAGVPPALMFNATETVAFPDKSVIGTKGRAGVDSIFFFESVDWQKWFYRFKNGVWLAGKAVLTYSIR